jgi:hypothetical protein
MPAIKRIRYFDFRIGRRFLHNSASFTKLELFRGSQMQIGMIVGIGPSLDGICGKGHFGS